MKLIAVAITTFSETCKIDVISWFHGKISSIKPTKIVKNWCHGKTRFFAKTFKIEVKSWFHEKNFLIKLKEKDYTKLISGKKRFSPLKLNSQIDAKIWFHGKT